MHILYVCLQSDVMYALYIMKYGRLAIVAHCEQHTAYTMYVAVRSKTYNGGCTCALSMCFLIVCLLLAVVSAAPAFLLQYMQETDAAGASNNDLVSEADPIYVASDEDVDGDDTQGKMLLLRGTVRHRKCLRIQTDANAAFGHGMCGYCASIPKLDDFRRRMIRQAGLATHGSHKNMR
jgi:hypothetical protein